jgi:hypothetical protein
MVGSHLRFPLLTILLLTGVAASGQRLDGPVQGLAQKIAAALKPHAPVALSLRNVSSMSAVDTAATQVAMERELRALGLTVGDRGPDGNEVQVTLSENSRGFVWVAEIRTGDTRAIAIEETPKPQPASGATSMAIEKKLVLEQDRQILDLAAMGRGLLVLDAEAVSLYESAAGDWQRKLSVRIPATRPWPRDLRGRLLAQGDAYQAYLPGLTCNGNAGGGMSITCRDASLWPIGAGPRMLGLAQFAPARNYFDGRVIAPNGSTVSLPAFFSAAGFQVGAASAWALAGVDAQTHLYNTPVKNSSAWAAMGSGMIGPEMIGLDSDCGGRSQVLASAAGDGTVTDSVSAYDVIDGAPRPTGDAVAFPGPVTALWPAAERGVALAVSRDLRSGRYAAFRLSITCAH